MMELRQLCELLADSDKHKAWLESLGYTVFGGCAWKDGDRENSAFVAKVVKREAEAIIADAIWESDQRADEADDRIQELEAAVTRWKEQSFRPLGDNHHNAALCPHCGEPLRKATDEIDRLRDAVKVHHAARGHEALTRQPVWRSAMSAADSTAPVSYPPTLPSIEGARVAHIPDAPGYAVTTDGRIFSCRKNGYGVGRFGAWKQLKPYPSDKGRLLISISINGRMKRRQLHRIIMEAFVGPCPDGMEVCHENGDHLDNRLDNLRHDTHIANEADKIRHGRTVRGERSPHAKTMIYLTHHRYLGKIQVSRAINPRRVPDPIGLEGTT